jgi:hypothetical protein
MYVILLFFDDSIVMFSFFLCLLKLVCPVVGPEYLNLVDLYGNIFQNSTELNFDSNSTFCDCKPYRIDERAGFEEVASDLCQFGHQQR